MDEENTETLKPGSIRKIDMSADVVAEADDNGETVTERLAVIEANEGYEYEGAASELDAFERQLAARDLDVTDSRRLVQDFFSQDSDNRYLFPEFVRRQVYLGMELGRRSLRLEDIVTVRERTTAPSVVSHDIDLGKEDLDATAVAQGAEFSSATMKDREKTVTLQKVGRQLKMTYESMKGISLPFASIFLQRFGFRLSRQVVGRGLKVLREGDGNTGTAATASETAGVGVWNYADLVDFIYNTAREEHEYTHICCNRAFMIKLLTDGTNFSQFQSQNVVEAFVNSGVVPDFFGLQWRVHEGMGDEAVIAWDRDTALRLHEEPSGVMVESEKLIAKQIETSVVSYRFAFTKDWNGSSAVRTQQA